MSKVSRRRDFPLKRRGQPLSLKGRLKREKGSAAGGKIRSFRGGKGFGFD
jgi:hypothetical protein